MTILGTHLVYKTGQDELYGGQGQAVVVSSPYHHSWEDGCMALSAGTRLGLNEILAPLGAGGMDEVNRADDLKLGKRPAQREHLRQIVQTLDVEGSGARPPTPRCAEQRSPQCAN